MHRLRPRACQNRGTRTLKPRQWKPVEKPSIPNKNLFLERGDVLVIDQNIVDWRGRYSARWSSSFGYVRTKVSRFSVPYRDG